MFKLMDKKVIAILPKLFLLNWPYESSFYQFHIFSIIYNLFCGIEILVDIKFIGRNCYGPKLTWADFVMSRNYPEPLIGSRTRTGFGAKSHRSNSTKTHANRPIERIF